MILRPAMKCWIPPEQQGLCSPPSHWWANCDFVLRFEALGHPKRQVLYNHHAHVWATFDLFTGSKTFRTPQAVRVM